MPRETEPEAGRSLQALLSGGPESGLSCRVLYLEKCGPRGQGGAPGLPESLMGLVSSASLGSWTDAI